MEKTVVLCVTHHGIGYEARHALKQLECPSLLEVKGHANLAKARSIAFDKVLQVTEGEDVETVLCVDDDMIYERDAIRTLVNMSRASCRPTAAVAMKHTGEFAGRRHTPLVERVAPSWLMGLACMAVPLEALRRVAPTLPKLGGVRTWCLTGEHPRFPGEWLGEDFWFCMHFDGVELAPVKCGHLKSMPIWPSDRTVAELLGPYAAPGTGDNHPVTL